MSVWGLARRDKIIMSAAALLIVLAILAALAFRLHRHYAGIVRFSADRGSITVDAAPASRLGTVLVTNKASRSPCSCPMWAGE
ncbi:MAG TPA: hypothetical protein VGI58_07360 [Streptosporangiaceae bacterium]|jgi:hypothetical protein